MRQWAWAWVGVVVMVGVGQQASAFNFLPVDPEVFHGSPGAQFGYSVALWNDENDVKRVVVGAPRDNQTAWWGENFPLGSAYYCVPSYGGGDGGGRCVAPHGLLLPKRDQEVKEIYSHILRTQGVGMGQMVVAERGGTKAVVCAPLYPYYNQEQTAKNDGLCFVLTNLTAEPDPQTLRPTAALKNSLSGFSAALAQENDKDRLILGGPNALEGCGLVYNRPVGSVRDRPYISRMKISKDCSDTNEGWAVAVGKFGGAQGNATLAVSIPKFGDYTGKVSFYPLNVKPKGKPLHTITEEDMETGAMFGYAMVSTDVDGDGAADLLVGAPFSAGHTLRHLDAGKVFVYYAPLAKDSHASRREVIKGAKAWARFGTALAALGDVDLDGYEDVAVGAPYGGDDGAGVVHVYNGGLNGLHIDKPKVIAASEYLPGVRGFGFSLAGGVDMDGNGYTDMAVGSLHSNTAALLRSSPVIKLQGLVYFNLSTIVVEESSLCSVDFAGQKKMRAVCVDLHVNITYTSYAKVDNLKLNFKFNLSDKDGTASYGLLHNNAKMDTLKRYVNRGKTYSPWTVKVFIQRSRANINLTLDATVTMSIESYSPAPPPTSSTSTSSPPPMPPILDVFTPSTYYTSTTLTCSDESTCFTKPDLALFVSGPPVILGATNMMAQVDVTLEVKNDPAYGIEVLVRHPHKLTFLSVKGDAMLPECRKEIYRDGSVTCSFEEVNADETVEFALTFKYETSELFSVSRLPFSLSVKNDVDSDTDKSNNRASVTLEVKKVAALYTSGFSNPEGTTVTVNLTATDKELKQVTEDPDATFPVGYLGPRLQHSFSLNNRGPSPVEGAKLVFHVPLFWGEERLTYFMEQPKSSPQVTCSPVPINPLGLKPPRFFGFDASSTTIISATTTSSIIASSYTSEAEAVHQRQKRELEEPPLSLTTDSSYSSSSSSPSSSSSSSSDPYTSTFPSSFQWTTDPAEYFSTTFDPVSNKRIDNRNALECMNPECLVMCNVSLIQPHESVNVTFSSYLVTATVSKLGFRKVLMRTWVTSEVGQLGSTIINPTLPATTEVFLVRPPERGFSALPLWVLILAIVVAFLLILIIILVLRKAGFFKRKRPPVGAKRESLLPKNDGKEDIS